MKAVCINNTGYQASLELQKQYEVIPEPLIERMIQIIDESGESYWYPVDWFEIVKDQP